MLPLLIVILLLATGQLGYKRLHLFLFLIFSILRVCKSVHTSRLALMHFKIVLSILNLIDYCITYNLLVRDSPSIS